MKLIEAIREIFHEELEECREYLGFKRIPHDISEIEIKVGECESFDDNILAIPEAFLLSESLLRAAIRFFVFNLFLPPNLKKVEEAKDFAMLYAYIGLEGDLQAQEMWLKIWERQSPEKKFSSKFTYRPVRGFTLFNRVSNGLFLREVLTLFWKLERYGERIDFEKYALILEEYMTKYSAKFSDKDKLILEYILREQPAKGSEVARALKIKETTLSNRVSSLKKRYILLWNDTINFSAIGLATYLLFFERGDDWVRVVNLLEDYPYFYNFYELPYGKNPALFVFLGPATNQYYEILNSFAKRVSKLFEGAHYELAMVDGFDLRGGNIRFYNNKNGEWDISWYSWGLLLKRTMEQEEIFISKSLKKIDFNILKELDEKDLMILEYVWERKEVSFNELRKLLRIGSNRLNEKLRYFRENKIILKSANVSMLGLVESVLFIGDLEKNEALKVMHAFYELPQSINSWSKSSKKLFSFIKLPSGGVQGIIGAIKIFYPQLLKQKLYAGYVPYGAYWKFKKELYDLEKKTWIHKKIEFEL